MITKNCLICDLSFEVFPSQIKRGKGKYCSRRCFCQSRIGHNTWNKGLKTGIVPKSAFKKGHIPWSKGKKCSQMVGNTYGFKKGHIPWNKDLSGCFSKKTLLQMSKVRQGRFGRENHPNWKDGRSKTFQGYIVIRHSNKYILEHKLVMEKKLGRCMKLGEHIHHINGIKTDNRPENLWLFPSRSDHMTYENRVMTTYKKWIQAEYNS